MRLRHTPALLLLVATTRAQTTITLDPHPLHTNVQRLGINLSGQTFYDSGQLLRNLVSRNPGFEGETLQSILHCKSATANTCTDDNPYSPWPANFLTSAHYVVLSSGAAGTITTTTVAHPPSGITLTLSNPSKPLTTGDFLLVSLAKPGTPEAGWWPTLTAGATLAAETHDLSPHTLGHQALRINSVGTAQSAAIASYFDTLAGHSFVQLHGLYHLTFRARPLSPNARLAVTLQRLDTTHGLASFLAQTLPLKPGWADYDLPIPTHESGSAIGSVALTFKVANADILLDDVALTAPAATTNPTAFRDEVVQTLRDLRPGTLRYMDNGPSFGSSIDNLLAPQLARQRSGASTQFILAEEIPTGIPEFLSLCKAIGADPWLTLPPGLSPAEAARLIQYLTPWTKAFHTIHLELGNEQWNSGSFAGATIADPTVYARRANSVFAAMRGTPGFGAGHYDLILGSWLAVPWWTQQELAANTQADTIALAPYLFSNFNSAPNQEQTFGPMFAQPEQLDSRANGLMAQQAALTTAAHKNLAIYETNLGTMSGSVPQSAIDVTVPSLGAALAVADHMLLMLRDLGITNQNLFCLPEHHNPFSNPADPHETTPLWGAVIDMGGNTNRRRPVYLALQLLNQAILPTMLSTHITGDDPTWNQPLSPNDKITLDHAHLLQTFAFADGSNRSLILLNLSRDRALPVTLPDPTGAVHQTTLTAAHITDSNELQDLVEPHPTPFTPHQSLPPHSLTVITWTAH